MGTAAKKKKDKTRPLSGKIPAQKFKEPLFASNSFILIEDIALGLLFFSLALLFSTQNLVPFTLPKLVALRIGSLILVLLAAIRIWKGRLSPVPKSIMYAGASLGLWWILASLFALHRPTALNGFFGRYNGLWTYWNYLILFFAVAINPRDEKQVERVGRLFIAVLIPVSLYAFLQYMQLDPIPWSTRWSRSVSSIGHGVPLAALLGMALPFTIVFLIGAETRLKKGWLLILLLVFIGAMLFTLSRGPWIAAFIGSMIVISSRRKESRSHKTLSPAQNPFISLIKGGDKGLKERMASHKSRTPENPSLVKKGSKPPPLEKRYKGGFNKVLLFINQKKAALIVVLFLLIIIGGWSVFSGSGNTVFDRFKTFTDLKTDTSFSGRIIYYKAALKGIKDHPLLGIGFENFRNVYPRYRLAEENQIFEDTIPTMVHNGYLQIALETGIPGLALYLVFLFFVFLGLIRTYQKKKGPISLALMSALIIFLIQDLSGWPDIALTPFFWVFLGLAVSITQVNGQEFGVPRKKRGGYFIKTLCFLGVVFLIALSIRTTKEFFGDRLFGSARFINIEQDWPGIKTRIEQGMEWIPRHSTYEDDAGLYYLKQYARTRAMETYKKGARLLEQAYEDNPFDPYVLIHRIDLERIALELGTFSQPSAYVKESVPRLLKLDRNNRTVYMAIARLKLREGKFSEALILIEAGNWLAPGSPNPRDEWTAAKHGLFLSFVKQRDFPKALKVLQEVITQYPDDVPSHVWMGNLYGAMKNWGLAREAFSTALKLEPENKDAQEGLINIEKAGK
jgi:hypothetical protein